MKTYINKYSLNKFLGSNSYYMHKSIYLDSVIKNNTSFLMNKNIKDITLEYWIKWIGCNTSYKQFHSIRNEYLKETEI